MQPLEIYTVLYESDNPITPERRFCAFLVRDIEEKKTGRKVKDQLPVIFYAATGNAARERAIQFWETETAKAKAKAEHGKKLGQSRKKGQSNDV
jgi:hypothetical protein